MRSLFSSIAIFFLSLSMPAVHAYAADVGPETGKIAPPVELTDLTGKTVSLSQLKGSVVLLNFWSTLCAPCVAEMPSLNRLYLSLRERGLQVLAVAIDATDKPVREFAASKNLAFTVLRDPEKEVFFDEYAGPTLPATYLIDRRGMIVQKFIGPREWDSPEMKNTILNLLEKR